MKCPACKSEKSLHLLAAPWRWCPACGAVVATQSDGPIGQVFKPERWSDEAVPSPGLLAVAADAVKLANDRIGRVDNASMLKDSPVVRAVEALGEAVGAIVAELQVRSAEASPTTVAHRLIDAGVSAVHQERERCARVAERARLYGGTMLCTGCPAREFPQRVADEIRKVP